MNHRPPAPHAGALPGCATPRRLGSTPLPEVGSAPTIGQNSTPPSTAATNATGAERSRAGLRPARIALESRPTAQHTITGGRYGPAHRRRRLFRLRVTPRLPSSSLAAKGQRAKGRPAAGQLALLPAGTAEQQGGPGVAAVGPCRRPPKPEPARLPSARGGPASGRRRLRRPPVRTLGEAPHGAPQLPRAR